jgi:hypothetical protein
MLNNFLDQLRDNVNKNTRIPQGRMTLCPVFPTATRAARSYDVREVLEYDAKAGRWRFAIAFGFGPQTVTFGTPDLRFREVHVLVEAGCADSDIRLRIHGEKEDYSFKNELNTFIDQLTDKVRDVFKGALLDENDCTPLRIGF